MNSSPEEIHARFHQIKDYVDSLSGNDIFVKDFFYDLFSCFRNPGGFACTHPSTLASEINNIVLKFLRRNPGILEQCTGKYLKEIQFRISEECGEEIRETIKKFTELDMDHPLSWTGVVLLLIGMWLSLAAVFLFSNSLFNTWITKNDSRTSELERLKNGN
jgi:hypothetical protein